MKLTKVLVFDKALTDYEIKIANSLLLKDIDTTKNFSNI